MDSDYAAIDREGDEVIHALRHIRESFRSSSSAQAADLMNQFWAFQDHLHRLVNTLANDPALCSRLEQRHPRLITEMVDLLRFTAQTAVGSLPAVKYSCRAVNELLWEVQNLKH